MDEFNQSFKNHGIEVTHFMPDDGSGVYVKGLLIPAGKVVLNHSHTFTHKSILASGEVSICYGGGEVRSVTGPAVLTIEHGVQHEVTAVTDANWFCIHASTETDPINIDHSLVSSKLSDVIAESEMEN